eukprot:TRINITY_DN30862_c0_g1_i1.p1 TRINITY_DN30862_c0_g1~~TRINITY_DN30862_c0_g1_i1.p1  ORF type:complete len:201 (+),score=45.07 TRINITY_DN30862_c0_g1_i1:134-736(+)
MQTPAGHFFGTLDFILRTAHKIKALEQKEVTRPLLFKPLSGKQQEDDQLTPQHLIPVVVHLDSSRSGGCAEVFDAQSLTNPNDWFIVKLIRAAPDIEASAEADTMMKLSGVRGLVKLYGYTTVQRSQLVRQLALLQEICNGGSLAEYIGLIRDHLPPDEIVSVKFDLARETDYRLECAVSLARELLERLRSLHGENFGHR